MKKRALSIAWSLCIFGLIAVAVLYMANKPVPQDGVAVSGDIGGAFTLTDQDGKTVTDKSWPDKYVLIYFGFTHCPDVCPLGLNKMAEALNSLPKDITDHVQPILITVDPVRDTPAELKKYVPLFYPTLVGLTGTEDQIETVKGLYKVYAQKQGDGADYMVNHSAFTYLMNPKGKMVGLYSHDTTAAEMAAGIQDIIEKN